MTEKHRIGANLGQVDVDRFGIANRPVAIGLQVDHVIGRIGGVVPDGRAVKADVIPVKSERIEIAVAVGRVGVGLEHNQTARKR